MTILQLLARLFGASESSNNSDEPAEKLIERVTIPHQHVPHPYKHETAPEPEGGAVPAFEGVIADREITPYNQRLRAQGQSLRAKVAAGRRLSESETRHEMHHCIQHPRSSA